VCIDVAAGSGILVGVGPRPGVFSIVVGVEGGRVVAVVSGEGVVWVRDFGRGRVDFDRVNKILDVVVEELMKKYGFTMVELMIGDGVLNMAYVRRAVWV